MAQRATTGRSRAGGVITPHKGDRRRVTRDRRGRITSNQTLGGGVPVTRRNERRSWTAEDRRELGKLLKRNTPTRVISIELGRSPAAVQSKARELGLSLRPVNRSPRSTRTPRRRK